MSDQVPAGGIDEDPVGAADRLHGDYPAIFVDREAQRQRRLLLARRNERRTFDIGWKPLHFVVYTSLASFDAG